MNPLNIVLELLLDFRFSTGRYLMHHCGKEIDWGVSNLPASNEAKDCQ